MLALIAACEVGFWVAVLAGLTARYLLRAPRAGLALLAVAPVLDLVLLAATAVHLRGGAVATWHHGLAAAYVGVSLAYGHRLVHWADVRFAHRFAGGPAPVRATGWAYARACWADAARTALAAAVAAGIVLGLVALVGAPERTRALLDVLPVLGVVCAVDLLWAVSYTVWPKRERAGAPDRGSPAALG
ncbi:hypothetical protein [Kineococcus esterisolvens]|uniref:hypothetical protein n=1 Tax=unclassified Kineococcus TaxID=2621656 RepID=UPI003D7E2BD4